MLRRYQIGDLTYQFEEGNQPERAVLIDDAAPAAPAPAGGKRAARKTPKDAAAAEE